jgi:glucose/mannose-6-phosphate isomerase
MFVVSLEVAALAGAGPRLTAEIDAAAAFLAEQEKTLRFQAAEIASKLDGAVPIVYGADLTASVARRWKTQANENAKVPAYAAEIPEVDHNEICGWTETAAAEHRLAAVFLEDRDQHPRESRRFDLTAELVSEAGAVAVRVETAGETRVARLLWATMLGDLVSLELATRREVDPVPVEALDRFKEAMSG